MSHAAAPPKGIYPPCVTFMTEDETVDYEAITKHVLRLASGGVVGLVIHGSNGEAVHLDNSERSQVIKHVRSTLDSNGFKELVIIAGCGAPSQRATLQLTREAKEAGAAFALVLPPNYWAGAMTMPVLLSYFKQVADESPLPVMLYNFPLVANGINLDSDMMIELAGHSNIVGAKLTCGVRQASTVYCHGNRGISLTCCRTSETCIGSLRTRIRHTSPSCLENRSLLFMVSSVALRRVLPR